MAAARRAESSRHFSEVRLSSRPPLHWVGGLTLPQVEGPPVPLRLGRARVVVLVLSLTRWRTGLPEPSAALFSLRCFLCFKRQESTSSFFGGGRGLAGPPRSLSGPSSS